MSESYHYLFEPWLAQGSKPPSGVRLPFDVIVLAAQEYQDPDLPGYIVMHVPLDDGPPSPLERTIIRRAAHAVANHVRARRRVLVTCWQGRNRSGVIVGLALRELGMPGREAVHRIRTLRNGLTNHYFRAMVEAS
jgi:protein-tyrosine phosphatase